MSNAAGPALPPLEQLNLTLAVPEIELRHCEQQQQQATSPSCPSPQFAAYTVSAVASALDGAVVSILEGPPLIPVAASPPPPPPPPPPLPAGGGSVKAPPSYGEFTVTASTTASTHVPVAPLKQFVFRDSPVMKFFSLVRDEITAIRRFDSSKAGRSLLVSSSFSSGGKLCAVMLGSLERVELCAHLIFFCLDGDDGASATAMAEHIGSCLGFKLFLAHDDDQAATTTALDLFHLILDALMQRLSNVVAEMETPPPHPPASQPSSHAWRGVLFSKYQALSEIISAYVSAAVGASGWFARADKEESEKCGALLLLWMPSVFGWLASLSSRWCAARWSLIPHSKRGEKDNRLERRDQHHDYHHQRKKSGTHATAATPSGRQLKRSFDGPRNISSKSTYESTTTGSFSQSSKMPSVIAPGEILLLQLLVDKLLPERAPGVAALLGSASSLSSHPVAVGDDARREFLQHVVEEIGSAVGNVVRLSTALSPTGAPTTDETSVAVQQYYSLRDEMFRTVSRFTSFVTDLAADRHIATACGIFSAPSMSLIAVRVVSDLSFWAGSNVAQLLLAQPTPVASGNAKVTNRKVNRKAAPQGFSSFLACLFRSANYLNMGKQVLKTFVDSTVAVPSSSVGSKSHGGANSVEGSTFPWSMWCKVIAQSVLGLRSNVRQLRAVPLDGDQNDERDTMNTRDETAEDEFLEHLHAGTLFELLAQVRNCLDFVDVILCGEDSSSQSFLHQLVVGSNSSSIDDITSLLQRVGKRLANAMNASRKIVAMEEAAVNQRRLRKQWKFSSAASASGGRPMTTTTSVANPVQSAVTHLATNLLLVFPKASTRRKKPLVLAVLSQLAVALPPASIEGATQNKKELMNAVGKVVLHLTNMTDEQVTKAEPARLSNVHVAVRILPLVKDWEKDNCELIAETIARRVLHPMAVDLQEGLLKFAGRLLRVPALYSPSADLASVSRRVSDVAARVQHSHLEQFFHLMLQRHSGSTAVTLPDRQTSPSSSDSFASKMSRLVIECIKLPQKQQKHHQQHDNNNKGSDDDENDDHADIGRSSAPAMTAGALARALGDFVTADASVATTMASALVDNVMNGAVPLVLGKASSSTIVDVTALCDVLGSLVSDLARTSHYHDDFEHLCFSSSFQQGECGTNAKAAPESQHGLWQRVQNTRRLFVVLFFVRELERLAVLHREFLSGQLAALPPPPPPPPDAAHEKSRGSDRKKNKQQHPSPSGDARQLSSAVLSQLQSATANSSSNNAAAGNIQTVDRQLRQIETFIASCKGELVAISYTAHCWLTGLPDVHKAVLGAALRGVAIQMCLERMTVLRGFAAKVSKELLPGRIHYWLDLEKVACCLAIWNCPSGQSVEDKRELAGEGIVNYQQDHLPLAGVFEGVGSLLSSLFTLVFPEAKAAAPISSSTSSAVIVNPSSIEALQQQTIALLQCLKLIAIGHFEEAIAHMHTDFLPAVSLSGGCQPFAFSSLIRHVLCVAASHVSSSPAMILEDLHAILRTMRSARDTHKQHLRSLRHQQRALANVISPSVHTETIEPALVMFLISSSTLQNTWSVVKNACAFADPSWHHKHQVSVDTVAVPYNTSGFPLVVVDAFIEAAGKQDLLLDRRKREAQRVQRESSSRSTMVSSGGDHADDDDEENSLPTYLLHRVTVLLEEDDDDDEDDEEDTTAGGKEDGDAAEKKDAPPGPGGNGATSTSAASRTILVKYNSRSSWEDARSQLTLQLRVTEDVAGNLLSHHAIVSRQSPNETECRSTSSSSRMLFDALSAVRNGNKKYVANFYLPVLRNRSSAVTTNSSQAVDFDKLCFAILRVVYATHQQTVFGRDSDEAAQTVVSWLVSPIPPPASEDASSSLTSRLAAVAVEGLLEYSKKALTMIPSAGQRAEFLQKLLSSITPMTASEVDLWPCSDEARLLNQWLVQLVQIASDRCKGDAVARLAVDRCRGVLCQWLHRQGLELQLTDRVTGDMILTRCAKTLLSEVIALSDSPATTKTYSVLQVCDIVARCAPVAEALLVEVTSEQWSGRHLQPDNIWTSPLVVAALLSLVDAEQQLSSGPVTLLVSEWLTAAASVSPSLDFVFASSELSSTVQAAPSKRHDAIKMIVQRLPAERQRSVRDAASVMMFLQCLSVFPSELIHRLMSNSHAAIAKCLQELQSKLARRVDGEGTPSKKSSSSTSGDGGTISSSSLLALIKKCHSQCSTAFEQACWQFNRRAAHRTENFSRFWIKMDHRALDPSHGVLNLQNRQSMFFRFHQCVTNLLSTLFQCVSSSSSQQQQQGRSSSNDQVGRQAVQVLSNMLQEHENFGGALVHIIEEDRREAAVTPLSQLATVGHSLHPPREISSLFAFPFEQQGVSGRKEEEARATVWSLDLSQPLTILAHHSRPRLVSFLPVPAATSKHAGKASSLHPVEVLLKSSDDMARDGMVLNMMRLYNLLADKSTMDEPIGRGDCAGANTERVLQTHLSTYTVVPFPFDGGIVEVLAEYRSVADFFRWKQATLNPPPQLLSGGSEEHHLCSASLQFLQAVPWRPIDAFQKKLMELDPQRNPSTPFKDISSELKRAVFLDLLREPTARTLLQREFLTQHTLTMSPGTTLLQCHRDLASSSSSWLRRWSQFSISLGLSSAFGFIFGIGDRHLGNILIHPTTGNVAHVDFNVILDQGQLLKVPERVPFRITPVLQAPLGPYGTEGAFSVSFAAALGVMQDHRRFLSGMLDLLVVPESRDGATTHHNNNKANNKTQTAKETTLDDASVRAVERVMQDLAKFADSSKSSSSSSSPSSLRTLVLEPAEAVVQFWRTSQIGPIGDMLLELQSMQSEHKRKLLLHHPAKSSHHHHHQHQPNKNEASDETLEVDEIEALLEKAETKQATLVQARKQAEDDAKNAMETIVGARNALRQAMALESEVAQRALLSFLSLHDDAEPGDHNTTESDLPNQSEESTLLLQALGCAVALPRYISTKSRPNEPQPLLLQDWVDSEQNKPPQLPMTTTTSFFYLEHYVPNLLAQSANCTAASFLDVAIDLSAAIQQCQSGGDDWGRLMHELHRVAEALLAINITASSSFFSANFSGTVHTLAADVELLTALASNSAQERAAIEMLDSRAVAIANALSELDMIDGGSVLRVNFQLRKWLIVASYLRNVDTDRGDPDESLGHRLRNPDGSVRYARDDDSYFTSLVRSLADAVHQKAPSLLSTEPEESYDETAARLAPIIASRLDFWLNTNANGGTKESCLCFVGPRVLLLRELCNVCGISPPATSTPASADGGGNPGLRRCFARDAQVHFEGFILSHAQALSDPSLNLTQLLGESESASSTTFHSPVMAQEGQDVLDAARLAWGSPDTSPTGTIAKYQQHRLPPSSKIARIVALIQDVLSRRRTVITDDDAKKTSALSSLVRFEGARIKDDQEYMEQLVMFARAPVLDLIELEERRVLKIAAALHEIHAEIHLLRMAQRDELTFLAEKNRLEGEIAKKSRSVAPVALNDVVLRFRDAEEAAISLRDHALRPLVSTLTKGSGGRALLEELSNGVMKPLEALLVAMTKFIDVHNACITSRRPVATSSNATAGVKPKEEPSWIDARELSTVVMPEKWSAVLNGLRMFSLLCKHFLPTSEATSSSSSSTGRVDETLPSEKVLSSDKLEQAFAASAEKLSLLVSHLNASPSAPTADSSSSDQDQSGSTKIAGSLTTQALPRDPEMLLAASNPTGYRRKMGVLAKLTVPKAQRIARVQALVREAIDTNNLSNMYHGWCPWL